MTDTKKQIEEAKKAEIEKAEAAKKAEAEIEKVEEVVESEPSLIDQLKAQRKINQNQAKK
jgi:hypothetical protein